MAISISGTVYVDKGATTMGAGRTVQVSVNGAASAGSTTTASDGTYTIAGITAASGAVLAVYLQGNTEAAATVTKSTGSNLSGIDLWQDWLNLRSDNGVVLSGTNLNTSDNNGDTGLSAIYSAPGNTTLTMVSGKQIHIVAGATQGYNAATSTVTGNVENAGQFASTGTVNGNLTNLAGGTITQSSGTLTVKGDFTNAGTLTLTSGTTISLTGTGTQTLTGGGQALAALTVNGAGGTYTLQDALVCNGGGGTSAGVNIANGALDVSASNFGVTAGSFVASAGTFVPRAGTVTLNKGGTQTVRNSTGSFNNLTYSGGGTLRLQTSNLPVADNLTVSSGTLDQATNGLDVTVGGDVNFTGGALSAGTRTFTLNGTAQTITPGTVSFYNLVAATNGDVISFTDGTTTTVSNAATFRNVTLQGTGAAGWTIAMPATQTIDHVTVSRSTATGNTAVAGTGSVDGLNNVNWTFPGAGGGNRPIVGSAIVNGTSIVRGVAA